MSFIYWRDSLGCMNGNRTRALEKKKNVLAETWSEQTKVCVCLFFAKLDLSFGLSVTNILSSNQWKEAMEARYPTDPFTSVLLQNPTIDIPNDSKADRPFHSLTIKFS